MSSDPAPPFFGFCTKESGKDAIEGIVPTLRAENGDPHMSGRTAVAFRLRCRVTGRYTGVVVRRLTPTECERLQGFPDGHTDLSGPDGPRYGALGNSMAVPVMHWLGQRISIVDGMTEKD